MPYSVCTRECFKVRLCLTQLLLPIKIKSCHSSSLKECLCRQTVLENFRLLAYVKHHFVILRTESYRSTLILSSFVIFFYRINKTLLGIKKTMKIFQSSFLKTPLFTNDKIFSVNENKMSIICNNNTLNISYFKIKIYCLIITIFI